MPKPPPVEPWLDELMQAVYASSIPFAFGAENAPSAAIRNGTCSAVQVRDANAFLLTAAHIVTPAVQAIQTTPRAICVIGSWEMEMRGRNVYVDEPRDLATVPLSPKHGERLQGDGRRIIHVDEWPPRLVEKGDKILFGGYPGSIRTIDSWDTGAFNATVLIGEVASTSSDGHWFSYHGDPEDMTQTDVATGREEEDLLEKLGGISGGPVFRSSGAPGGGLELVGIVSEAPERPFFGHILIRFARRLDLIRADGSITGCGST